MTMILKSIYYLFSKSIHISSIYRLLWLFFFYIYLFLNTCFLLYYLSLFSDIARFSLMYNVLESHYSVIASIISNECAVVSLIFADVFAQTFDIRGDTRRKIRDLVWYWPAQGRDALRCKMRIVTLSFVHMIDKCHCTRRNSEIVNVESCRRQISVWDPRRVKFFGINPVSSKKIFYEFAGDSKYPFGQFRESAQCYRSFIVLFSPRVISQTRLSDELR